MVSSDGHGVQVRGMGVRPSAVAGAFYPAQAAALRTEVRRFVGDASAAASRPKALIVPHAGYVYSGAVAGQAYRLLMGAAPPIRRVILLGPNHRVFLGGMALPSVAGFASPLGEVVIDQEARELAVDLPGVVVDDRPHALEHALEVQLPFLQVVLGDVHMLPVVVGQVAPSLVARLLSALWGGDETLIVVSSDMSHFLPYSAAVARDTASVQRILSGAADLHHDEACGATPVNGLTLAATQHGLQATLVAQCNSGDTVGDRQRVVGYASLRFDPPALS